MIKKYLSFYGRKILLVGFTFLYLVVSLGGIYASVDRYIEAKSEIIGSIEILEINSFKLTFKERVQKKIYERKINKIKKETEEEIENLSSSATLFSVNLCLEALLFTIELSGYSHRKLDLYYSVLPVPKIV